MAVLTCSPMVQLGYHMQSALLKQMLLLPTRQPCSSGEGSPGRLARVPYRTVRLELVGIPVLHPSSANGSATCGL